MSERIGIIGGSFDPIHNGHLIIALDACEQFELDTVLFVPAYLAPLKAKAPASSPDHRMAMTRLAIEGESRFACSDVDFRFGSTSYSVRTARAIGEEHPGADLLWILGSDQLAQLHHWRDVGELAALVSFIAFERPGSVSAAASDLPAHLRIHRGNSRQLQISSTEIRERLKSGRPAKYFLPANVFDYIKAENLYS